MSVSFDRESSTEKSVGPRRPADVKGVLQGVALDSGQTKVTSQVSDAKARVTEANNGESNTLPVVVVRRA